MISNTSEDLLNKREKKKLKLHNIRLFCIITIVFTATCLQTYSLLFTFFDKDIILPDLLIKKEIIILFTILFSGLEIAKCVLIYRYSSQFTNLFLQYFYAIILTFMAFGFYKKLLYLIGVSMLLLVGVSLVDCLSDNQNSNFLFFGNLIMVMLSTVLAFCFYVMCIIN